MGMQADTPDTRLDNQQEAYRVLGGILERTRRDKLPPISWMLGDGGAGPLLVGRCEASDPIRRQEDFHAWQVAIGAETWPKGIRRPDGVHLHASKNDYDGVMITLAAHISAEEIDA
jgi:hypothetical protein